VFDNSCLSLPLWGSVAICWYIFICGEACKHAREGAGIVQCTREGAGIVQCTREGAGIVQCTSVNKCSLSVNPRVKLSHVSTKRLHSKLVAPVPLYTAESLLIHVCVFAFSWILNIFILTVLQWSAVNVHHYYAVAIRILWNEWNTKFNNIKPSQTAAFPTFTA